MREELKKVIGKAEDCIEDARYLFEGKRYDASVNRAYYAVFTSVQGLLLNEDIFVKTHSGAKVKFHEHFIKTGLLPAELGKIFEDVFAMRQEADYDFSSDISEQSAKQTIDDAEEFLNGIKKFLSDQ